MMCYETVLRCGLFHKYLLLIPNVSTSLLRHLMYNIAVQFLHVPETADVMTDIAVNEKESYNKEQIINYNKQ